jgi:hypothetical protein
MSGLDNLPKDKWADTGKQPILKQDPIDWETAILQVAGRRSTPNLSWVDTNTVRVLATADTPARSIMAGFPSILHPSGRPIDGSLVDGKQRINTSDTSMSFGTSSTFWGSKKNNQWYAVFAVAGDSDTTFTLKAMPWFRVSSQASQVITLRNNANSANIGYGFTTDELVGGQIYMISGGGIALLREITANNNDNSTGGTITYTGSALALTQGNYFMVLPPTNFRWLGDFWVDNSGNVRAFDRIGNRFQYRSLPNQSYSAPQSAGIYDLYSLFPPMAKLTVVVVSSNDAPVGGTSLYPTNFSPPGGTYPAQYPDYQTGQSFSTALDQGHIYYPLLLDTCKIYSPYSVAAGGWTIYYSAGYYDYPEGCM